MTTFIWVVALCRFEDRYQVFGENIISIFGAEMVMVIVDKYI
jgi:hypothetical protein